MEDIYTNDKYAELNPTWHEEDALWKATHFKTMLEAHKIGFKTACEVGCGTGDILRHLSHFYPNAEFTGYEISPHAYARAKEKEAYNLTYYLGNVLEREDAYYDLVIMADVMEHVENYFEFLKGLKKLGKYKAFHIPLDMSAQSVWRGKPIMNLRQSVGHIHYFSKDTALASLEETGYKIVDYKYTASRIELPNQALSSRLMSLPRRLAYAVNSDWTVRVLGGYSLLVLAE